MRARSGETIRPVEPSDLGAVAEMIFEQFILEPKPVGDARRRAVETIASGYSDLFFSGGLWRHEAVRPLVSIDGEGAVSGFLGAIAHPMRFEKREILTAVTFSFVAHPERATPMTSVKLMRKFLEGPQELTLTDGANDGSRRMMAACGGETARIYCMQWRRLLQPARDFAQEVREKRPALGTLARIASPVARLVDAGIDRAVPRARPTRAPELTRRDADADGLRESAAACAASLSLAPSFDPERWSWRLARAAEFENAAPLQIATLHTPKGAAAGGYAFYMTTQGAARVLDLHARGENHRNVVDHLLTDAMEAGATSVWGKLDPGFMRALADRRASFSLGEWTLIHARNPAILNAIHRGDARLGFFEGEASVLTHIYETARAE